MRVSPSRRLTPRRNFGMQSFDDLLRKKVTDGCCQRRLAYQRFWRRCSLMATTPSPEPIGTGVRRSVHAMRPHIDGGLGDLFRSGALAARAHGVGSTALMNRACTDVEPVSTTGSGSPLALISAERRRMHPCVHMMPEHCVRLALPPGHSSMSHVDACEGSCSTLEGLSLTDAGHPEGVAGESVASSTLQDALVGRRELERHRTSG